MTYCGCEVVKKRVAIEEGKITHLLLLEGIGGNEGGMPTAVINDNESVTMTYGGSRGDGVTVELRRLSAAES